MKSKPAVYLQIYPAFDALHSVFDHLPIMVDVVCIRTQLKGLKRLFDGCPRYQKVKLATFSDPSSVFL